jgi:branched-chain amino acid transport system permease protein
MALRMLGMPFLIRWLVPVLFGVTIIVVLVFEPLGLAGRWLKARLYFQLWPFR